MMPADDIAAIRGLLQEALEPYEGLPKTVRDLTDEVVALRFTVSELAPSVERHTDELRGLARALREVEPTVDRLLIVAGETVPELVRRIEAITKQVSYDAERRAQLSKSVERLEEEFDERDRISSNGE